MNSKLRQAAARMNINNPYHHDFLYNGEKYFNFRNLIFTTFDLVRVYVIAFILVKLTIKAPSFLFFCKTNYINNPDYMLVSQEDFIKLQEKSQENQESKI